MKRKITGNVIRAQGTAFRILDLYGFRHPSQIDVCALATDRGVSVRSGGLSGCEARLIRVGSKGIMRVRDPELGSARARFNVSHELGHWELHADTQAFLCTSDKLRDYKTDPQESEANAFASELLMPTYLVRPIIESHEPSLATTRGIASEFNVSVTAAAIRIFLETRHECFLVLSRHGQVCWWMSGSERYGIWLESKQPLQPRSLAYHIDEGIPLEPETVPSESWFLHLPSPENVEVTEDSMQLGQTGFVLSFLTLGDAD
ncbi:MAG TPA: ImmA/IrrE family metallo-endopeptidase [Chthoniobacterales bacterium]|nr:ImmA/IrrE family metallo-endopeptidase [Chthoniobacterales bacterium]